MGPRLIVIVSVASKNKPQMRSAKYNDLIKAFAPKRADKTFGNSVLPWRSEADWSVTDAHSPEPAVEYLAIGAVIVTDQILRCRSPGERLGDLPGQPFRRGMPRYLKPQQLSPAMAKDQEDKQPIKGHRRDDAQINRGDRIGVVA
jgi:hypothetical protein